jgi:hypothetical protein
LNIFKKIVFAAFLLVGCKFCFAQEIRLRGGFNLSQFRYKYGDEVIHVPGAKLNPGFNVGAMLDLPIKNMFSLETGILLNSKGNKISGSEISGVKDYLEHENLLYLDVPVLLKITVPAKKVDIFAMAGPYIGQALSGKHIGEGIINSIHSNWEYNIKWGDEYYRFDYGTKIGLGLQFDKYQIGTSYEFGFKNLSVVKPSTDRRNRVLELYVSYALINLKSTKK